MNPNSPMFKRKFDSQTVNKSHSNGDPTIVRRRFPHRHKKNQSNRGPNNNNNSQNQPNSTPTNAASSSSASSSSSSSSSKRNEQNHRRDDNQQTSNNSNSSTNNPTKIIDLTTSPSPHKKQTRSKLGLVPHPASQPAISLSTSPTIPPNNDINNVALPPASIITPQPLPLITTAPLPGTILHPLAQLPPGAIPVVALPPSPVVQPLPQPQIIKKPTYVPRSGFPEVPLVTSHSTPTITPVVFTPPVAPSYSHPNSFSGKAIRRPSLIPPWGVPKQHPSTPIEALSTDHPEFYSILSDEILRFAEWLALTPNERRLRNDVIQRISNAAKRLWPKCYLKTIGSIETNLCLPSSDIDLVVFGAESTRSSNPLEALGGMIRRSGMTSQMQLITRARVPIIKLVDRDTGYRVDISFEVIDGVRNTDLVKQYLNAHPQVQPLVLAIKSLLNYYRLNETFSGGIGSYALTILVTYFVQSHPGLSLGEMLTAFFYEFGCTFDYEENGVSILRGPHLFSKSERGWLQEFQPGLLSIEDPANPENDVGRGSFEIIRIKEAFKNAYQELTEPQPDIMYHSSLLCRIIWMTPEVLNRR